MSSEPRRVALSVQSQAVWTMLFELYEDDPHFFEVLAVELSRARRPSHGAVTIQFNDGHVLVIERRESFK